MKTIEMVILVLAVSITIAYFIFVVWNVFITKRQVALSAVDLVYWEMAGILGSLRTYDLYRFKGVAAVILLSIIGICTINHKCNRNEKEQNEK